MKHYLQNDSGIFYQSERFNPSELIAKIVEHLAAHPDDIVEHLKDWNTPRERKKFYGLQCIDIYEVNPKTGKPSKVIDKGGRIFYVPLVDSEVPF